MRFWKNYIVYDESSSASWRRCDRQGNNIVTVDIGKEVAKARVTSSYLYAAPNSKEFRVLACYKELMLKKYNIEKKVYSLSLLVLIVLNVFFLILSQLFDINNEGKIIVLLLFALIMMSLNWFSLNSYEKYEERSEFLGFVYNNFFRKNIWVFALIFGTIAIHYQSNFNLQHAYKNFGMLSGLFLDGEYWRSLTAPLTHAGLEHAIINYFILLTLFPLVSWISMKIALIIMTASAIIGHIAYAIGSQYMVMTGDLSVGISGAVAGIIGYMLGLSMKTKLYPKHWFIFPVLMAVLLLVLTPYLNVRTSNIIHYTGFFIGLIGAIYRYKTNIAHDEVGAHG